MTIFESKNKMAFFSEDFVSFFIELAANNNKDWFDLNRKRYEKNIKEPFKTFVEHCLVLLAQEDDRFKETLAKDCIFRINRDIRFSKDKTPYKLNLSAILAPGGKKDHEGPGLYFEMGPEHVRFYAGIYEADKDRLLDIREAIANDITAFQKLYKAPAFEQYFGPIRGEVNKILPKDLKEAAEKEPLLFNKQFYFFAQHSPEVLTQKNLDQMLLEAYRLSLPVQTFLKQSIK